VDVLKVCEPWNKTLIELAQLGCSRLRKGCKGEKYGLWSQARGFQFTANFFMGLWPSV